MIVVSSLVKVGLYVDIYVPLLSCDFVVVLRGSSGNQRRVPGWLQSGGYRWAGGSATLMTTPLPRWRWLSNTNYLTASEHPDFNVFTPDAASCSSIAISYLQ
jgi:hypothetical protein